MIKGKSMKHSIFSNIFFAIKWHYKISPIYTIYCILNCVIGNVITTFEFTFLSAYIIDCIENKRPLNSLLSFLIPVSLATAFKVIQGPIVSSYFSPRFEAKFRNSVILTLYQKAVKMEISKYDNSQFYNDFVLAMRESPKHITSTLNDFSQFLSFLVNGLITGAFIVVADKFSFLIAVVVIPFSILLPRIINKLFLKREEEMVPIKRKIDYACRVFYLADFIKDIKLGRMAEKIKKEFKESSEELEKSVNKYGKRILPIQILNNSIGDTMTDGVFLIYLFYQTLVLGRYGLGMLLGLYNSSNRFLQSFYGFSARLPQFQNHSLFIDKLRVFLNTPATMLDEGSKALPQSGDIELKNVEFGYDGDTELTIKGISMHIKKGEKVALVGYNGAGKSTLIKLILRLYDPTNGAITFGGNNLKEYPLKKYREKYGVLFQDFEIIATNIARNISMSDEIFDLERADLVLEKVAFIDKLKSLPNGYKTELTKEFSDNGVELSGGEAQKLALARVLYSTANILILDEPSSALDPLAEYELNKAVTEISKDKTVIIISHRLSTTRFVDKIYMLENGRIIEQGNHESLLKINGKYAQMFRLQTEKYVL